MKLIPQKVNFNRLVTALVLCLLSVANLYANTDSAEEKISAHAQLEKLIPPLQVKSFKKKIIAVKQLANIDDPQSMVLLEALLKSKLYYQKADKSVVIIQKKEAQYEIFNALDNSSIGLVEKKTIKKISTNNKLRKTIRTLLAQKKITHADLKTRKSALKEILTGKDASLLPVLKTAQSNETDDAQKDLLKLAIALIEVDSKDSQLRHAAIKILGNSLYPSAKGKLNAVLAQDDKGEFIEQDKTIIAAAQKGLKRINAKLSVFGNLETLFFGLSLGSVLLLAAIGLSITFGVMGVINMAHGELIMLGAYTTYLVQQLMPNDIGLSLIVAIPAAFVVSGLFGIAIERGVIRHLYGRPLETLLATFGISLLLQQMVRTLISAQNVPVITPSWLSGSLIINPAFAITYNRIYIFFFALMVFALLILILKKTSLGLQVRAVAQNRSMATAMGIKTQWVDSLTFGLGSGVAGVAGVALSQLTNVGPNLGQAYIIDSFMVVVFGGVENLWGTLVAAMTLGITNKFLEPWAGAVMSKIIVLIFLIIFIQKRPNGLFPQKGRSSGGH
ncbi:urea ABC transporter permease subunit UrtB [sulfur-oxidizing endosymbiont of Gigantopelta aegis]|uniref:urea ABC transporter permease subunit UrtB n=1 Tax=sulfur-oxidizing endosymbiont of Gigantopelta aegis TaxID=2794934 RepID=UPI0018DDA91A|nr:urea ABC transporter permease subunit UrtB [sulfur-oxidizing endosymbiont of Gigantopelta aegis]